MVDIKSKREIELMKEVCRITALTHEAIKKAIKPGVTTKELDRIAEKTIRENGGIPAQARLSKWRKRGSSISCFNLCIY